LNLGGLKTDGLETQVHWGVNTPFLGGASKLYVDSSMELLHEYEVQLLSGTPFVNYTGVSVGGTSPGSVPPRAAPRIRLLTTFGYKNDAFSTGFRWQYQSSLEDVSAVLTPNAVAPGVASYQLWALFASYKLDKFLELRGGINNLFDKGLPYVASSQNGTDIALYDPIGREFYVGAKVTF
jgi:outer membrane receptor for ferrienterochelin and colicin